jgi:hypothetical protein
MMVTVLIVLVELEIHLKFPRSLVFMLDKICPQQHCSNIPIKLIACLQYPLESRIPLIRMACI